MNNEEKNIFEFMKTLSDEDRLELCEGLDLNEDETDEVRKDRVKNRIMREIKTEHVSRNIRVKRRLIAAAVILILICTIIPFGGKSFADIIKKLYFIPGFGKVEQSTEKDGPLALLQSVHYKFNQYEITIKAVIKEKNTLLIRVEGDNGNIEKYFGHPTIEDKDGNKYTGAGWHAYDDNSFIGEYYFKNIPVNLVEFNIILDKNNKIPVTLKRARSYEDYAAMGPSDTENNLGITLIPYRDNDKIRFNLLQHPSHIWKVSSYQKATKDGIKTEITVSDEKGKKYNVNYGQYVGDTLSEFYFAPGTGPYKYTVEISEILLKYNKEANKEITLPVLKEGDIRINKQIDLNGFKLDILNVTRVGDKLGIFVNTNYNKNKKENLSDFTIADHYSFMKKFSDDGYIEYYELDDINPRDKQITLKITDMYTRLKGPWKFEIASDNMN